jgi:dihydrofolate reductase
VVALDLADGGERLHEWVFPQSEPAAGRVPPGLTGANLEVMQDLMSTGAVVAGRGTFEPANEWGGDHHDGVPIFILSRNATEDEQQRWPLVSYVADVATAMSAARDAAGDKDVLVHGVTVGRLALAAGMLDEIQLHIVPVLLGSGRRLLDNPGPEHIELERIRVLEGDGGVTHLRYRVRR